MNTNTTPCPSVDSWLQSNQTSWLLSPSTPIPPEDNGLGWHPGEARLWWAVVVQAALDTIELEESEAMDAAEFLKDSGAYLVEALFGIPADETRKELAHLILRSPTLRKKVRGVRNS